jgi:P27 family predicted phage terminase small subunit
VPEIGKEAWFRAATELHRLHLLAKTVDVDFATLYADTYAKWATIAQLVNGGSMLATGQKAQDRKHPAMQLYRELSTQLLSLQVQTGMTPNSRLRMKAPEIEEDGSDADLLD